MEFFCFFFFFLGGFAFRCPSPLPFFDGLLFYWRPKLKEKSPTGNTNRFGSDFFPSPTGVNSPTRKAERVS